MMWHVRQIRLAAAVRKTATFRGFLEVQILSTCTKACFVFFAFWGGEVVHLARPHKARARTSNRAPERLRRLQIGRFPIDGVGRGVRCEFESRRSCQPRWLYA